MTGILQDGLGQYPNVLAISTTNPIAISSPDNRTPRVGQNSGQITNSVKRRPCCGSGSRAKSRPTAKNVAGRPSDQRGSSRVSWTAAPQTTDAQLWTIPVA